MAFYSFFYNCKNMDTKDYLAKESYPLSTQSLDFIQNQILFVQKIGALLGEGAWLIKEATAEKRGLVFVNQNGVCELVALVVGSGFKYYWIERTIENETTTEVLMGANSYTPGPNETLISNDGLKKIDNLWQPKLLTRTYMNNLIITKDLRTKMVTIQGTWKILAQGYNTITIDNAFAPSLSTAIWATDSITNAAKGAMVSTLGEIQDDRTLIMLPYSNTGDIQLNGTYYAAN